MSVSVALIGDYNPEVLAHQAIPDALKLAAGRCALDVKAEWIETTAVDLTKLRFYDAIWCVPASPYKSMTGALEAIQYARENKLPFLGTCGGYQHAALEYARNVLGYSQADNAEVNPDTEMPLIAGLSCKLVEATDSIFLKAGSIIHSIYGTEKVEEAYHCSFGVNPAYLSIFEGSQMSFTGKDDLNDPRTLELTGHPFFVGTAFQPERSAFKKVVHPLVVAFLNAVQGQTTTKTVS